jgi:hypothetical protein
LNYAGKWEERLRELCTDINTRFRGANATLYAYKSGGMYQDAPMPALRQQCSNAFPKAALIFIKIS